MLSYYFFLGLRSLKRNPILTTLMVMILAIGVAASVSTLTILHVMSGDPIPQKSDRLFAAILDNGPLEGYTKGDTYADHQLTYKDTLAFLNSSQGVRRAGMYGILGVVDPIRSDLNVTMVEGVAANADFFSMFDVSFLYGQGWQASEDKNAADVVVFSKKKAETIFGKENPVGKKVRMMQGEYTVVGVTDDWVQRPRFFIFNGRGVAFTHEDEFFVPLSNAIRREIPHNGNMSCSNSRDPGWQSLLDSECTWFHFWFETKSAHERADLKNYIDSYVREQQKLGRFQRRASNKLFNVREWLDEMKIIADDSKLSAWLAFGFLLLCLVNAVGLLLAKFSVRAPEIGVRRALGASRGQIFSQFLIESSVVGLVGSCLGIVLAFGALYLIGVQSKYLTEVAHLDWQMVFLAVLLSIISSILAGLLPTWRACQVTPAIQLKSQ